MLAAADQERVVVDVDEHRCRPDGDDCLDRRDERVGRHDHFVAFAEIEPAQDELERVGAVRDADALLHAAEIRELGLEVGDVRRRR